MTNDNDTRLPENSGETEPVTAAGDSREVPASSKTRRWRGRLAGWFLFLLLVAVVVVAAYFGLELRRDDAALRVRLEQLDSRVQSLRNTVEELRRDTATPPGDTPDPLRQAVERLRQQGKARDARLAEQERQLAEHGRRLATINEGDRTGRALYEAQSMLRMAALRLRLAGEPHGAAQLLENIDRLLAELPEAVAGDARIAVARDLSALEQTEEVDIRGIHARLKALRERIRDMEFLRPPLPEDEADSGSAPAAVDTQHSAGPFARILDRLSPYLMVTRREGNVPALLDPQWQQLLRQNLLLLLGQAQIALLTRDTALYHWALTEAEAMLRNRPPAPGAAVQSLAGDVAALRNRQINPPLPDLAASRAALERAVAIHGAGES